MIEIHNKLDNINQHKLSILHSALIYGSNDISTYPNFINKYENILLSSMSDLALADLNGLLGQLASASEAERTALVSAFEAEHPALFKRLYSDLITAFYSAPETAERIHRLADAGPREVSPHFDPSLLDAVIIKQAGKRRL